MSYHERLTDEQIASGYDYENDEPETVCEPEDETENWPCADAVPVAVSMR